MYPKNIYGKIVYEEYADIYYDSFSTNGLLCLLENGKKFLFNIFFKVTRLMSFPNLVQGISHWETIGI
jgi:hypothetical protein